jgi:hypothetical protein
MVLSPDHIELVRGDEVEYLGGRELGVPYWVPELVVVLGDYTSLGELRKSFSDF